MTEEAKGQSPEDNVDPAPQEATQADSPQTATDDGLPERFRGKSPEEIARSYLELEKKLGEQGSQVGELKNELAFLKNQSQFQRGQQYQPPAPRGQQQADVNWDDKFLESPYKTTQEILKQYDQYRRFTDAQRSFPRTLREAKALEPSVFGDADIAQNVETFVRQGVQQGTILPEVMDDVESLVAIGVHLKYQKDRQFPQRTAVNPTLTESPAQVKRPEPTKAPVQFDRSEQDFIHYFKDKVKGFEDFNEEKAAELVREAEKEKRGR
uniref:Uncharacterized protein n=1 Tax=viral metagenome TaxID=1070528 RepID=A0A6M3K6H7_9ZZZZ